MAIARAALAVDRLPPSEQQGDFFFLAELRLPILHALGIVNWVWY